MTADTALPEQVIEDAERLTRLARRVDDEERAAGYRQEREQLLAAHDFVARVREDEDGPVLVCYPAEWLQDGEIVLDRIDDRSRAVERSLAAGGEDWDTVEAANRAVVERVAEEYGPDHAANVRAFADFLGNHHTCRIAAATADHREAFLTEYYPRNAWPSDAQRAIVEQSLAIAVDVAGECPPVE